MADADKTIELIFQGVDKTGAATQAAIKNTEKFASNVEAASQPLADLSLSAVKLEASLLAAGLAVTAFSVKVAGDFDTSFREIATLIDAPVEGLDEFKGAIAEFASGSTQPLDEVTAALYTTISAGTEYGDAIASIAQAEQLAVAGRADLNATTLVLASTMNAYGAEVGDAERYSDVLFTTVKQGLTTLPELSASLSNVTGTAATLGVPFETLSAAIATLTSVGTPTAQAITQINSAMAAFIKPSSEAATLAEQLGLDFSATAVQSKGFEVVLQEVIEATGGSQEEMAKLFGSQEALKAIFPLTGTAAAKFADTIEAMGDATGATGEAFDKMSLSIDYSVQKVQNSLTGLFIAVGDPLLDEFGGVAEAISEVFKVMAESAATDTGIGEMVAFIEGQFATLQDTLVAVAQHLPAALEQADFSGFINGVEAISDALGAIMGGIDLKTVDGLATAITSVGKAFEALSEFSGGVIKSFGPLVGAIGDVANGLLEIDPDVWESLGKNVGGMAIQANLLAGAVGALTPALSGLVAVIGINQTSGLIGSMIAASGSTSNLIKILGSGGLLTAAGAAGYALGTLANEAAEAATGSTLSTTLVDWAIELGVLDDEATRIVDSLNDVPAAVSGVSQAAEDAATPVKSLSDSLDEFFAGAVDSVGTLHDLSGALDDAGSGFESLEQQGQSSKGTFSVVSNELSAAAEATRALSDSASELQLEERLAMIEAQSVITTTQIRADADKTIAAYESLNVSIESTESALDSLYGLLGDDDISKLDKLDIESQIELENERRQEALDLQNKLVAAQIAETRARTDRLRGGDALITVNGAGLAPHLEAIMFELLEAIQVRVNADGLQMLLGASP